MPDLLTIDDFDNFREVKGIPPANVTEQLRSAVRDLDEREELEPFIRQILSDSNATPHGPAEIVDILTHKATARKCAGIAAFILKGKSFPTVRPQHAAHQIFRLERIAGLRYAILGASGIVLDEVKEQFLSTVHHIKCDYAFLDVNELARLFVAYGFLCPKDGRRIVAGRCACGYSPRKRILNVLQREALRELKRAHDIGQRAGVVVLPPGSGKTRIAAEDANQLGAQRLLYVAHTHEILDVAHSEFVAVFENDNVALHTSLKSFMSLARVNLATVQLLQHNKAELPAYDFDYLVVDEFHHAAAKSYRLLLERIRPRFLLGLTATPFRGDQQDVIALCDGNVLVNFELRTGIEKNVLSPYHYYGCFDDIDYSKITRNGQRYDVRDLERTLIIPERHEAIIKKWRELADGLPTLAFCCSHRHAQRVAESFAEDGIASAVYLSTTPAEARKSIADQLRAGTIHILCTVDVLNEGADLPFVECLLFLRPTESQRIFYQQLGRGLRRSTGKAFCVVIDFIGNFKNSYKVVEYHALHPVEGADVSADVRQARTFRDVLNLPIGCEVHFDDRVIDLFARQIHDPRFATRHNIGRILLYQYESLLRKLGRLPSKRDVDRNCLLDSRLYELVWGSWRKFEEQARDSLADVLARVDARVG